MYLQNVKNSIGNLKLYFNILKIEQSPYSKSCYITFVEKGSKGGSQNEIDYRLRISDHRNNGGLPYNLVFSVQSENGTFILNKLKLHQLLKNVKRYNEIGAGNTAWVKEYMTIIKIKNRGYVQFSNQTDKFV